MRQTKLFKPNLILRLGVGYFDQTDHSKGYVEVLNSDEFNLNGGLISCPFNNNSDNQLNKVVERYKEIYSCNEVDINEIRECEQKTIS